MRLTKLEVSKTDTEGFLIVCGDAADAERARKFLGNQRQDRTYVFATTGVRNGTKAEWLRQSRENRIDMSRRPRTGGSRSPLGPPDSLLLR